MTVSKLSKEVRLISLSASVEIPILNMIADSVYPLRERKLVHNFLTPSRKRNGEGNRRKCSLIVNRKKMRKNQTSERFS